MRPAFSVIFLTTLIGVGQGLFLALVAGQFYWVIGATEVAEAENFYAFGSLLALAFLGAGLFASFFHLAPPERAWRAASQWRTSWLSREVIALPAVMGIISFYGGLHWLEYRPVLMTFGNMKDLDLTMATGYVGAALVMALFICTGMIYASLKTIPAWHMPIVPLNYLILALMTGAVWFLALLHVFGQQSRAVMVIALVMLVIGLASKVRYWRQIDNAEVTSTSGSATGLGTSGNVRLLETPNTSANYLNTEMGFRVARKHALKLRRIAILTGFIMPVLLVVLSGLAGGLPAVLFSVLAAFVMMAGIVTERWLFFAEARHVVNLYYGETAI